ncbi:type VI secretion system Vgr family protein [Vibrio intestinalis]|uniref:type VI secretion system Vgr family protein n=1 Tax=Vibrio intestinalis TaxID=2933291 RepID=UPI0021A76958|nr:type VI secretion system tip protein VgrG [Vibrio intestinalis]
MVTLNFTLQVDGLDPETFVVHDYHGTESISCASMANGIDCHGYHYQVELASRLPSLTAADVVDKTVQLDIYQNRELVKTIHGIASSFSQADSGHHHSFYSLTLVPSLKRLALRQNSRIFQQQTVPEIISVLLQEMGIEDYAFAVQRDCLPREFCVQYRETDLAFLERLAAEEGLRYSFVHQPGKHTLLFTDSNDSVHYIGDLPYNALSGGMSEQNYVSQFSVTKQAQTSHSQLNDYSFKKPHYAFSHQATGSSVGTGMEHQRQDQYEHFDYPGRFKDDASGKAFNQTRLEYLRRSAHTAQGKSNHPQLQAGHSFSLSEHLDDTNNQTWLIAQIHHQGSQPQALEEEGGSGATTYANQFHLVPAIVPWRATPTPKPLVDGPMIALVVGPEGEEIFCDEHGRVKLHFPWDRYSNADEQSSCWVRVSQGWAGSQYGMMAIPRIGHEVIVSFLNGDPDQPIITGRTYHATNTPPYALPEHKTKTILRSETHQGQGYNELSFEDQAGQEQIYLHAQKDLDAEIKNDHTTHIKHDKHLTVDNDSFALVKNNKHTTINGESRTNVTKDTTLDVTGSIHNKVGKSVAIKAGTQVHLKAGNKVVLDVGNEITISAGGSFVKIDPAGVHMVGPAINLNSGGGAGSGCGYSGQVAALPNSVEEQKAPEEITKLNIASTVTTTKAAKVTQS